MEILNQDEEHSNNKRGADFDWDEDSKVWGEGLPHLKKVLHLLRPMVTSWKSMYYLIKLALALKDLLVKFKNSELSHNGEYTPTSPTDDSVEVFIWINSYTMTPVHLSYARRLCPPVILEIPKIELEYWQMYKDLKNAWRHCRRWVYCWNPPLSPWYITR